MVGTRAMLLGVVAMLLVCSSAVMGERNLPTALLESGASSMLDSSAPSHESVSALQSLVNQHSVDDDALAHADIDAEMAAIESAAAEVASSAAVQPTAFIEKPSRSRSRSSLRSLRKLSTSSKRKGGKGGKAKAKRGYRSNSKEDFISRPLDYSPTSNKLYRAAKRDFARSLDKDAAPADADVSRLQLLANQLKMKRLTVERQKIEIANDEVKVAHLHDLLDANKNILVKNQASLKRSAKAYLEAVKRYTNKIDESLGTSITQGDHKKALRAAADAASKSASKQAADVLKSEREKVNKLQEQLNKLRAGEHGAGGIHPISERKGRKGKKGKNAKKGGKNAKKDGKKAKKDDKKASKKSSKKSSKKGDKKGSKKAAPSRFQQIMTEIEQSERESDRLINSTEGNPMLLSEEELVPVDLQERLRENQQEVSALIESTPADLAEHGALADQEYTVIPTGNIKAY